MSLTVNLIQRGAYNNCLQVGGPIGIRLLMFCAVAELQKLVKSVKFTKTRKIPGNLVEILSNTCQYNIFETYLDCWGSL